MGQQGACEISLTSNVVARLQLVVEMNTRTQTCAVKEQQTRLGNDAAPIENVSGDPFPSLFFPPIPKIHKKNQWILI